MTTGAQGGRNAAQRSRHFRAQLEAVEAIRRRLQDVTVLLDKLNTDVDVFAARAEFKQLLTREENWLREAQKTVADVSAWRARESNEKAHAPHPH